MLNICKEIDFKEENPLRTIFLVYPFHFFLLKIFAKSSLSAYELSKKIAINGSEVFQIAVIERLRKNKKKTISMKLELKKVN